ncbi:MAG: BMP family ABC transporter substrate-binding protein [Spirochaetales bacterium]|jgi:basic membrane protein A and related proteins|nr:BMP family ABC transporter substrate-binding protein [Spirochaetales bacterium]
MKRFMSLTLVLLLIVAVGSVFAAPGAEEASGDKTIKAGFIYVGPIGDYGWSHAHDQGRLYVEEKFPWLETVYVESVPEGDSSRIIDRLIQEEKVNVIFTTSFGYMDDTVAAAEKYPDVTFMHCSGFKTSDNLGTYFGDLYQAYYLNGIIAGALTKTNMLGYVAAFPIPELVRHINALAMGAKAVNPDAEVHVRWTYAWYGPEKAKEAAESLIASGSDFLAFTEDTPAVIEVGQDHFEKGDEIYTFSHYSPMQPYGVDSAISGQLSDWGVLYEKILQDIYDGTWTNERHWWLMEEKASYLGAEFGQIVNPKHVAKLKAAMVDFPGYGNISVYDLISQLTDVMTKEGRDGFDPYDGPITDNKGNLQIPAGERATIDQLESIMYYVDGVVGDIPQ